MQYSTAVRNAQLDAFETTVGASPRLRFFSGSMPANCAAASTGTLLAELTLPADWLAAASSGSKSKAGTWSGTGAAGAGLGTTIGYYRIFDSSGTTCHEQGTVGSALAVNTSSATAVNSNVLNFASTAGISVGQFASGTGVPAGAVVLAVGGSTVTLSIASTAGVGSGVAITFSGDMTIDNTSIAQSQAISVDAYAKIAGNA